MRGLMPTHLVTVRVERSLSRYYPIGSDTPLPEGSIVDTKVDPTADLPSRDQALTEGDVILDGLGTPYVIGSRRDPGFSGLGTLHAFQADKLEDCSIDELPAPLSLVARWGQPIQHVVMFR